MMANELNQLAKDFGNQDITVLQTNINLYNNQIAQVAAPFLKQVASQSKKSKSATLTLVAIIVEAS